MTLKEGFAKEGLLKSHNYEHIITNILFPASACSNAAYVVLVALPISSTLAARALPIILPNTFTKTT
jgi:hypothetical protein